MGRLSGKVAVITGAGTGIGRAAMVLFAKEGAKVIGVSRRIEKLNESLEEVKAAGGDGRVISGDVGKAETAEKTIDLALKEFDGIDILVNNAGVGWNTKSLGYMEAVDNLSNEGWHDVISTDLGSAFYFSRRAVKEMRARKRGGSIINVASVAGSQGLMDAHAYCAAKGGMINLTRSMAIAYAAEGIRVNTLSPGFTDTALIATAVNVHDEAIKPVLSPMNRAGYPDEMAHALLFFASDDCKFCTGANLVVDGGQSSKYFG